MCIRDRITGQEIQSLGLQAVAKFPEGSELYIKPMFFCADGFLLPDADKTQCVLHVFKVPMPGEQGFAACFSSFARSWPNMAPTDAKASCLYPNGQRAIREAMDKGFDNAIMLDGAGNVAEFASSNLWIATVSYTHLDVYKRQRSSCTPRAFASRASRWTRTA